MHRIQLTSSDLDASENRVDDIDILRILIVKFRLNGSLIALCTKLNNLLLFLLKTTFDGSVCGDDDENTHCVACNSNKNVKIIIIKRKLQNVKLLDCDLAVECA